MKISGKLEDDIFATKATVTKLSEFQDQEFEKLWNNHKESLTKEFQSEEKANDFLFDYVFNHTKYEDFGDFLINYGFSIE